jgi:hypothetical protein
MAKLIGGGGGAKVPGAHPLRGPCTIPGFTHTHTQRKRKRERSKNNRSTIEPESEISAVINQM